MGARQTRGGSSPTKIRALDSIDKCFRIHHVKSVTDDRVQDDDGYKVHGPHRLKLLAEFPENAKSLTFFCYDCGFGEFPVN